jgi:hypothetical protein
MTLYKVCILHVDWKSKMTGQSFNIGPHEKMNNNFSKKLD